MLLLLIPATVYNQRKIRWVFRLGPTGREGQPWPDMGMEAGVKGTSGAVSRSARHRGKTKLLGQKVRVLEAALNLGAVETVLRQRSDECPSASHSDRNMYRQQVELQVCADRNMYGQQVELQVCAGVVCKAFDEKDNVVSGRDTGSWSLGYGPPARQYSGTACHGERATRAPFAMAAILLLSVCSVSSLTSDEHLQPPARETPSQSTLPCSSRSTGPFRSQAISSSDLICDNACHCSSKYAEGTIARRKLQRVTLQSLFLDACTAAEECDRVMHAPVTVVVGVFSRPGYFEEVTSAILRSSVNVTRLWIVSNGSPHLELFRKMTAVLREKEKGIKVDFFSASLEVGYYERFLVSLCCLRSECR